MATTYAERLESMKANRCDNGGVDMAAGGRGVELSRLCRYGGKGEKQRQYHSGDSFLFHTITLYVVF